MPHIRGCVSVSCCYMGMTLKEECHCTVDSPSHLSELSNGYCDEVQRTNCLESNIMNFDCSFNAISMRKLWQKMKSHYDFSCTSRFIDTNFSISSNISKEKNKQTNSSNIFQNDCMKNYSFPLSQFARRLKMQPFKYKSFECACHFIDDQRKKLLGNT